MVTQISQHLKNSTMGQAEKGKSTSIVLMSSKHNNTKDRKFIQLATQAGIDQILAKPITRRDL